MHVSWTPDPVRAGQLAVLQILLEDTDDPGDYTFRLAVDAEETNPFGAGITHRMRRGSDFEPEALFTVEGNKTLTITRGKEGPNEGDPEVVIPVLGAITAPVPTQTVALVAGDPPQSADEVLWSFIRQLTAQLRFEEFHEFVEPRLTGLSGPEWFGTDAYRRLFRAAETFVEAAADPTRAAERRNLLKHEISPGTVSGGLQRSYVSSERDDLAQPFLRFAPDVAFSNQQGTVARGTGGNAAQFPLPNVPFVELIWNYWHEEGGLVQTMNHILARFQNRRVGPRYDVLARFDLNPLLPLRNLLWGFAEDEQSRLTVRRRAAEYMVQYGLPLVGRAVPPAHTIVDRRTQFLEGFHALLHAAYEFYKERDDKTVDADAFPLLSSLREVHLVLAHGAHNQFADLPLVARAEMLTMQWILAQPEMREFLGGPTMVPYEEDWMDRVDTMKNIQGWPEASITHFFELAVHGEQLLLSIRHGRWNESGRTREDAANWALTWRNEVQRYIHAYRTVTGVDLATTIDATMPSVLLARRGSRQIRRA
ncbi:hypothetical protein [Kribbella sp. CA-247076]|uniref:hypothetical protein n=1 Tax=Kribbella sp. CA-247076 TaxID=3239941 RepID=UPI003D93CF27